MSVVARRIRATPERSASETWRVIVDLLAPGNGSARVELMSIEGIASSIISTESPKDSPIVVKGEGPRIRIYCLFDDDAVSGDDANESALAECPTAGDWTMSLPVEKEDVEWMKSALANKTKKVTVREKSQSVDDNTDNQQAKSSAPSINMEAFLRS